MLLVASSSLGLEIPQSLGGEATICNGSKPFFSACDDFVDLGGAAASFSLSRDGNVSFGICAMIFLCMPFQTLLFGTGAGTGCFPAAAEWPESVFSSFVGAELEPAVKAGSVSGFEPSILSLRPFQAIV